MNKEDQGISPDRYTIIPRTLIFPFRGDQMLLIKGAADKRIWADKFNGIGGHIEQGEDPLSAARRELKEETALEIPDIWLCGTILVDTGSSPGVGIFVFRAELTGDALVTPSQEGTLEWININDYGSLPLVEDLFTLLPLVINHRRGSPVFSAIYSFNEDGKLQIEFGE